MDKINKNSEFFRSIPVHSHLKSATPFTKHYIHEEQTQEHKAGGDGDFLTAIAEQPNEILKCAMYLFLDYLDGATQFAQSCGGGGGDTLLPWDRRDDEDDRRFTYRCMMQAHKMLKTAQPKRKVGGIH